MKDILVETYLKKKYIYATVRGMKSERVEVMSHSFPDEKVM